MLKDYVKEELVVLNLDSADRTELFKQMAKILVIKHVKEGFYDFIVEREENYPTGLDLAHIQLLFHMGIQNISTNRLSQSSH